MIHFIKVTITVYIFSLFCYSIWYLLQYYDVANLQMPNEWIGSLCYLPHGARVLMSCFFRYYSLPGLYLAELSGPLLNETNLYVDGWQFSSIGSLISVIIAVEIVKWARITPGYFSIFKPINFKNYKFVFLVILISALLNSIIANMFLIAVNENLIIEVTTVFRFMVGDILGALAVIISMWVGFSTLVDNKLLVSPEND